MASNNNNPFITGGTSSKGKAPAPSASGAPAPGGAVDEFSVDLTDVEEQGLIPEGTYRAKCADVIQDVSKGGNPMFTWTFEVLEGKGTGRHMKVFTAITPAAMWKVAETVIALGVGQAGSVVKFKRSDVIGKECGVTVADDEYNGNVRSQIQRVMSLDEMAQLRAKEQ